jgi:hypothetical protein
LGISFDYKEEKISSFLVLKNFTGTVTNGHAYEYLIRVSKGKIIDWPSLADKSAGSIPILLSLNNSSILHITREEFSDVSYRLQLPRSSDSWHFRIATIIIMSNDHSTLPL